MKGRRPKPTHLKVISGNPGKRPLNLHEPKPAPAMPTCPAHLNPSAKEEWKRLARQLYHLGLSAASTGPPSRAIAKPRAGGRKLKRSSRRPPPFSSCHRAICSRTLG